MRVRGLAAAAALVALVLATTGCTKSAPEITNEQVSRWEALAAKTLPAATEATVYANTDATMAGSFASIRIELSFTNFTDLKASERAIGDLEKTIEDEVPEADVTTSIVNEGSELHGTDVGKRLVAGVPGLASATVIERSYGTEGAKLAPMLATVRVFVDDVPVVNPHWLDLVATAAQTALYEVDAQVYSISILPTNAANMDPSSPEFAASLIQVGDLEAFKDLGVDNGCVRTDSWAYDVSNPWAIVYPADATGGACA